MDLLKHSMNAVAGKIQLKWVDNSKRESQPSQLHIGECIYYDDIAYARMRLCVRACVRISVDSPCLSFLSNPLPLYLRLILSVCVAHVVSVAYCLSVSACQSVSVCLSASLSLSLSVCLSVCLSGKFVLPYLYSIFCYLATCIFRKTE